MVETGRRRLTRRDHVNALAAALRVAPAEIAPNALAGSDEWAPSLAVSIHPFPALCDEITEARHRDLAAELTGYAVRGDTYAAGAWLRRLAREPGVSPWLLLDQLITRGPAARTFSGQGAAAEAPGSVIHGPPDARG
jgi:hypothetical protein